MFHSLCWMLQYNTSSNSEGKFMGSAPLLSHLTNRDVIKLLCLSFKPSVCTLLCIAVVWTPQISFFFASWHQSLLPIGGARGRLEAGGGGKELPGSDGCSICWVAGHLRQLQVAPSFSLFRHFQKQPHWAFSEIPAPAGGTPATKVRAPTPRGSHCFSSGLLGADNPTSLCSSISATITLTLPLSRLSFWSLSTPTPGKTVLYNKFPQMKYLLSFLFSEPNWQDWCLYYPHFSDDKSKPCRNKVTFSMPYNQ